jgi:hypothetical protein
MLEAAAVVTVGENRSRDSTNSLISFTEIGGSKSRLLGYADEELEELEDDALEDLAEASFCWLNTFEIGNSKLLEYPKEEALEDDELEDPACIGTKLSNELVKF